VEEALGFGYDIEDFMVTVLKIDVVIILNDLKVEVVVVVFLLILVYVVYSVATSVRFVVLDVTIFQAL
jgi:hypothetical protein